MNRDENYLRVIRMLKDSPPELTDKERLTESIMRRITPSSEESSFQEKIEHHLFGWVNLFWLRGVMTITAVCLLGLFIVQQFMVTRRLNELEVQLVRTVQVTTGDARDLGNLPVVVLNAVIKDSRRVDSIQVSRADLEVLLNNYLEMMKKQALKMPDIGLESSYNRIRKQRFKEDAENNKSL